MVGWSKTGVSPLLRTTQHAIKPTIMRPRAAAAAVASPAVSSTVVIVFIVTLAVSAPTTEAAPFLQQLADWVGGIKYVPPHEAVKLFAPAVNPPAPEGNDGEYVAPPGRSESKVEVFAPANEPPSPAGYEVTERSETSTADSGLVFNEDGWLRTGETEKSYRLGKDNMNWEDARDWCKAHGGYLAEPIGSKEHFALSSLLGEQKAGLSNFWIGLRQPFFRWDSSRRLVTWGNWKKTSTPEKRSCTIINGKNFGWENHDCTYNLGYRPLCQKADKDQLDKEGKPERQRKSDVEDHCVVVGVTVDLKDWLERNHDIKSAGGCHNICLRNDNCNFWTWDRVNHLCYLKEHDSQVQLDENFEAGTTLKSKGCNRKIKQVLQESRVEVCSCQTQTTFTPIYNLDPRSLPFHEDGDRRSEGNDNLGRYIANSACPPGQELVCTDDTNANDADLTLEQTSGPLTGKPNITDCLVYDVRLAAGKAFRTLYDVSNPETCHAHCLTTANCAYWTWRGELKSKTCFLLQNESRMVRRAGSAAGTVLSKYSCNTKLAVPSVPEQPEQLEGREDDHCVCELEEDGWTSLLDPRAGPTRGTGRIVNQPPHRPSNSEYRCPQGYIRICSQRKFKDLPSSVLEDWDFEVGRSAYLGEDITAELEPANGAAKDDEEEEDRSPKFRFVEDVEVRVPRKLKAEGHEDVTGGEDDSEGAISSGVHFPE